MPTTSKPLHDYLLNPLIDNVMKNESLSDKLIREAVKYLEQNIVWNMESPSKVILLSTARNIVKTSILQAVEEIKDRLTIERHYAECNEKDPAYRIMFNGGYLKAIEEIEKLKKTI